MFHTREVLHSNLDPDTGFPQFVPNRGVKNFAIRHSVTLVRITDRFLGRDRWVIGVVKVL